MEQYYYGSYDFEIGLVIVVMSDLGLVRLILLEDEWEKFQQVNRLMYSPKKCEEVASQLKDYFEGTQKYFKVPFYLEGTPFQQRVWKALLTIPYGEVRSYGEIADLVGSPKGARAVGAANRANPIPIIIPCHRVVGKKGAMVGYMGDHIDLKEQLLSHELKWRT